MNRLVPPDTGIVLVVMALVAFGAIMVYSASSISATVRYGDSEIFIRRHLTGLVIALIVGIFFTFLDYHLLLPLSGPLMFFSIFLMSIMVLVPELTRVVGGAPRWLNIGVLQFQPSETAKFSLVLFMASYFSARPERISRWSTLVIPMFTGGLICMLVLLQRDLSTVFILLSLFITQIFLAGISAGKLLAGTFLASLGVGCAIVFEQYRLRRILAFLDPWSDPYDSGYHAIQSLIAVGSGGLHGLGLTASRQKLRFLPEPFTDYIYAVIGEELGFIGAATILLLYLVLVFRGCRVARRAPDLFGFLLASGVVAWISIQAIVNIAVVLGMLPATGLPLPFISYGRTALISLGAGVGVLLNVSRHDIAGAAK